MIWRITESDRSTSQSSKGYIDIVTIIILKSQQTKRMKMDLAIYIYIYI